MPPPLLALAVVALAIFPRALALTPLEMLSTNQYSPAIPNPTGEFALISGANVTFDGSGAVAATAAFWNLLNLTTGSISTWALDSPIAEVVFAGPGPRGVLYLNSTNDEEDGGVSLYYAADALHPEAAALVASLPAPYAGLKAAAQGDGGDIRFLLYCQARPDGSAYNPALDPADPSASTARIYDSAYVRIYDHWRTEQLYAVFGGTLSAGNGTYSFDGQLTNYVTGICNVTCAESPIDAGSGTSSTDYDLSPDGSMVAFNTKDVHLPLANYSSTQIYLVDFDRASSDAVPVNPRGPTNQYPEAQGASSFPLFSPNGTKLLYLQMNSITNPSDRNVLYLADVAARGDHSCAPENSAADFAAITRLAGNWDRSPLYVGWASDSRWIWAGAPHLGGGPAFAVPVTAGDDYVPYNITSGGTILGAHALPDNALLVTDSKIWTPCDVYSVRIDEGSPGAGVARTYFQAHLQDPILAADGLGPGDVSEIWYASNTSNFPQQAWVVYPKGFNSSSADKRYPLAMITHGGPEASSFNLWGLLGQFNLKAFADQGYVVVAPNPTGSWGWGQNFTDAAYGRWGTYPYWDLVSCFRHVEAEMPFVDTTRAVHAGASFGGFMSNWIQGQEMGRWFKALVTHDGLTSTDGGQMATDQLGFAFNDFLGPLGEKAFVAGSPYHDFNPLLYVDNWATPHFVVHSSEDYRLPVAEGLSLFNMLQQRGVPSRFLNFPEEGHVLRNPANELVWHEEIFKWINYYSGISNATSV